MNLIGFILFGPLWIPFWLMSRRQGRIEVEFWSETVTEVKVGDDWYEVTQS